MATSEMANGPMTTEAEPENPRKPSRPARWRRLGLWRAIAGMAVALAAAALIVSAEFSAALVHRTSYMNHRISQLTGSVHLLRRRLSSEEKKSVTAQQAASADDLLKRVLAAHDLKTIKLSMPAHQVAGFADAARPASATVASSASEGASILQVSGLRAAPAGAIYGIWWVDRKGRRSPAGSFSTGADGKATVPLDSAPKGTSSVLITLEKNAPLHPVSPTGVQVMRGVTAR